MIDPIEKLKSMRDEMSRFMLTYKFALKELETKIEILKEEFQLLHDYNPIEHTKSRLKSFESILNKIVRRNGDLSFDSIQTHVKDIAGIRITCSFITDIYYISNMLKNQRDLRVLEEKDYIKNPKPNGYRSLHLLIEVPVFMSDREERVCVEIQIRTIAMDFWASLEHKIYYKYQREVPSWLVSELCEAAETATALDHKMERLHKEIKEIKQLDDDSEDDLLQLMMNHQQMAIPEALKKLLE